ncbi:N-acetyltransferase family protein [Streptomyces sp. NPDC005151]
MTPNHSAPADPVLLRRATVKDAAPLTGVFLASRARSMPYLPKVHSDEDTLAWMTHVVLPETEVWVAEAASGEVLGFASLDGTELEHLCLRPDVRRRGIGSLLLAKASRALPGGAHPARLPAQHEARAFYERHRFAAVDFDDGSRNEEKEPDVMYRWVVQG